MVTPTALELEDRVGCRVIFLRPTPRGNPQPVNATVVRVWRDHRDVTYAELDTGEGPMIPARIDQLRLSGGW